MKTMIIKVKRKSDEQVLMTTGVSELQVPATVTRFMGEYDMAAHSIEITQQ